jgi:TolB-like protein/DNA-binding winged helix-turn-helix (wHTH) protein/Tfp pilus assembly protein PilF
MISEKPENSGNLAASPSQKKPLMSVPPPSRYVFAEFVLEPQSRKLSQRNVPVHLTRKPFQVLLYLVEHRDRLVTRAELLERFWEGHEVYDETLTKSVGAIRKALDDQSEKPRFIETKWSEGYRFVCEVEEQRPAPRISSAGIQNLAEETDSSQAAALENGVINSSAQGQSKLFRRIAAIGGTCVVLALVALAVYLYRQPWLTPVHVEVPIRSIAVLPLKNLTNDPENEYFSDGMTDSLITALSKVEGLRVTSRGSVFHFKGQENDPRELGKQLNVAAILEGSVRKDGESVRVAVRLVSTDDGRVLWTSETYDRSLRDIFALQDEIARSVATGLRVKLTGAGDRQLVRRYTNDVDAYQLYLKGRYYWNERTEAGLEQGIEYFKQAIAKDPGYAQAYAGLADSYILMGVGDYSVLSPKEAMPRAKAAALKALELDETLAEAHTSLGFLNYVSDWDFPGAEHHFKRAIILDPNYVTAHHWYALFLGVMGRFDESIDQARLALTLDPSSPIINTDLGLIFTYARQPDRAIEQLKKTIDREPSFIVAHWRLGRAYAQKGMYPEALAELQKTITATGRKPYYVSLVGYIEGLSGNRQEALKILKELKGLPRSRESIPALIATVHIGLGNRDEAFAYLDKAYQGRFTALLGIKVDSMFDPLRADPRFPDLERRVGLVQ